MDFNEENIVLLVKGIVTPLMDSLNKRIEKNVKETNESIKKTNESIKKTNESIKETNESIKETNESIKKRLEESSRKFDKDLKKSRQNFDKRMAELSKQIGGIGNGDYAEEFFYKSLKRTMKLGNIKFRLIDFNLNRYIKLNNLQGQYDLTLANSNTVAVIEVISKLTKEYVNDFYNKKLKNFKRLFTKYKDYKLYGAVASFSDFDNARELSKQYGLFVLGRAGEHIDIINDRVKEYI